MKTGGKQHGRMVKASACCPRCPGSNPTINKKILRLGGSPYLRKDFWYLSIWIESKPIVLDSSVVIIRENLLNLGIKHTTSVLVQTKKYILSLKIAPNLLLFCFLAPKRWSKYTTALVWLKRDNSRKKDQEMKHLVYS